MHEFFLNFEHLCFTWKPIPCNLEQIANSFIAQTLVLFFHSFKCLQNYSGLFTQKQHVHKALIMCVNTMIYIFMASYLTYLFIHLYIICVFPLDPKFYENNPYESVFSFLSSVMNTVGI